MPTQRTQARDRLGIPGRNDGLQGRSREWWLTAQHLVQNGGEAVHVRSAVHVVSGSLFRAHVPRGSDGHTGDRQVVIAGDAECPGDSEVRNECMPVGQQDVFRFHIPVHDILRVGVFECIADLGDDRQRLRQRHGTGSCQPYPERVTVDVRHHEVQKLVGLSGVKDRDDIGMNELRRELDLSKKPFSCHRRGELGIEYLDRHRPARMLLRRQKHGGHAASPDLTFDVKAVADGDL